MRILGWLIAAVLVACVPSEQALAQDAAVCPRPAEGSAVSPPPDLFSHRGVLATKFQYHTTVDQYGRTLFCFQTPDGKQSPTLHVKPGDTIRIALTNMIPTPSRDAGTVMGFKNPCGSPIMFITSVNMHFHGTNTSPECHSDEVIRTLVNSFETFEYKIAIPTNEPPGLYWYHPHVHGISSPAVQGGASGLIEVEGIANIQPIVGGLPQRFLVVRDQPLANPTATASSDNPAPFWDVSLNYVPVSWPNYAPAAITMNPGTQEFWRLANASADTILDLKLIYDGKTQPLKLVALDGVPIGSQDGRRQGYTITRNDIFIPPAGRAEFIVNGPPLGTKHAVFLTEFINTGWAGDRDTRRPLANINVSQADLKLPLVAERNGLTSPQRFEGLANAKVTAHRKLFFAEKIEGGGEPSQFYITVAGQQPKVFNPTDPPAITTHQGAVEDWVIQNRSPEVHEFHMHQIHFLLLAVDGKPVPKRDQQFYDTYQVKNWNAQKYFPSIKVRMDFRGAVVGDFVYHCHILDHEDAGMMAKIRVLPKK